MAEQTSQVACLRIPKEPESLLLPNVSVAEVIPYEAPSLEAKGPEWFLGTFQWRNIDVPVVSLELMDGDQQLEISDRSRYAIINRLSDSAKYDFFAVAIKDLPTLVRVHPEEIKELDRDLKSSERAVAKLGTQDVVIPDLEKIEVLVNDL